MNDKIIWLLGFSIGVATGGAVAWLYAEKMYAKQAEEEIASVKESYARREAALNEKSEMFDQFFDSMKEDTKEPHELNKGSIVDYAKRIQSAGYTDYSTTIDPEQGKKNAEAQEDLEAEEEEGYRVISEEDFGEDEDYGRVSLYWFSNDGVLADEYGSVMNNAHPFIVQKIEEAEEEEQDSVYIRHTGLQCDYEVLVDHREFTEFLNMFP